MNRVIKINKIEGISYESALEAVKCFITKYGFINKDFGVKVHSNYKASHVKCSTTPTSHIFYVWLAV